MKKKLSAILIASAIVGAINAQENNTTALTVPQVKTGQCQALVIEPAKFEARTEKVVIKEATKTIEIVPAEYEWVEEQVMIKPAGEELKVIPATYKTVTKEIEIEPKQVEKQVIPPKYGEVSEEIVERPAHVAAKTQGNSRTFQTAGEALVLTEVAAENKVVKKQVVQEPARVENKETPAKTVSIEVQEIDQEARVEKVPYEAQYKTVKVKKLVKEAQEVEKEIPAEYAEIKVFTKVADAQMRWEEVLCSSESNAALITKVQKALNDKGYKVGRADGSLGPSTMRALEKFQRENNLATGGVTAETLKALGVEN